MINFPGGSVVKNPPAMQETWEMWFDPWVRKTPWRRGWQLQHSCLGNPMDRGAWWATVHGVAKDLVTRLIS